MFQKLRGWLRTEPDVLTIDLPESFGEPDDTETRRTAPDELVETLADAGWTVSAVEPTTSASGPARNGLSEAYTVTVERHSTVAECDD